MSWMQLTNQQLCEAVTSTWTQVSEERLNLRNEELTQLRRKNWVQPGKLYLMKWGLYIGMFLFVESSVHVPSCYSRPNIHFFLPIRRRVAGAAA